MKRKRDGWLIIIWQSKLGDVVETSSGRMCSEERMRMREGEKPIKQRRSLVFVHETWEILHRQQVCWCLVLEKGLVFYLLRSLCWFVEFIESGGSGSDRD